MNEEVRGGNAGKHNRCGNLDNQGVPPQVPHPRQFLQRGEPAQRTVSQRGETPFGFVPLLKSGNLFDTLLALDNQGVPPFGFVPLLKSGNPPNATASLQRFCETASAEGFPPQRTVEGVSQRVIDEACFGSEYSVPKTAVRNGFVLQT